MLSNGVLYVGKISKIFELGPLEIFKKFFWVEELSEKYFSGVK
jgi:hypothetical protein